MNAKSIASIIRDYGMSWVANRSLYALKLAALRSFPVAERLFERECSVKRVDVFEHALDYESVRSFLKDSLSQAAQQQLIDRADRACEGTIEAFSSLGLSYGNPVQWFVNPQNGEEISADKKWFYIPDFDERTGDIKVFWEISRFSQAILFARASLLTGDSKYCRAFYDELNSWLDANPYSYGPNYKCGQENALRMINVLIAHSTFVYLGMSSEAGTQDVFELVRRSYNRIRSNFFYADKCIRNNHTLSELCGLVIGAWCCGDRAAAEQYFEKLEKELMRQFLPDGGYIQWSFNYQRFALQLVEMIVSVSDVIGFSLTHKCMSRIKNSANLLFQVQSDDGILPNYGSNDGALIFPLSECEYRDYRPLIACLFRQTGEGSPYCSGMWDEESCWFASRMADDIPHSFERSSSAFPDAGLFTLDTGDLRAMIVLQDYSHGRPAQMDQLHLDVSYQGKNVLCDAGTYSYASKIGDQLSRTAAHNTVLVNRCDQMDKVGNFLVFNWTKRISFKHSGSGFIGKLKSTGGYAHERKVTLNGDNALTVFDIVCQDTNSALVDVLFHTPFDAVIVNDSVHIHIDAAHFVELKIDRNGLMSLGLHKCSRSPKYLQLSEGTVIVATYSAEAASKGIESLITEKGYARMEEIDD